MMMAAHLRFPFYPIFMDRRHSTFALASKKNLIAVGLSLSCLARKRTLSQRTSRWLMWYSEESKTMAICTHLTLPRMLPYVRSRNMYLVSWNTWTRESKMPTSASDTIEHSVRSRRSWKITVRPLVTMARRWAKSGSLTLAFRDTSLTPRHNCSHTRWGFSTRPTSTVRRKMASTLSRPWPRRRWTWAFSN